MAVQSLDQTKHSWAQNLQPSTSWKLLEHLFRASIAKQQLYHDCTSILVSFRFSLFLKPCHAYDRSYFADSNELLIVQNGWVMAEKSGFKVSCSLLFLLVAWYLVRFLENGCWICVSCAWLVRMMHSIYISGQIIFSIVWVKMKIYCSDINPNFHFPDFGVSRDLHACYCFIHMSQSQHSILIA